MTQEKESHIFSENISPGRDRTIAHLENLMVVVFDFNDGPMKYPDPFHSHPHEQITYVAEGELLFLKGTEEHHLSRGDLMIIPPGIPHAIQTLTSHVRLVDSFNPLRQDFL
ncbi:MAG: cupin domain-containing protein [Bacteroidales bacterium]|nr:cupin domain-containing protein [Bacteroidales bacterium]MBK8882038.1 cupin domain-containing protein [Bacteroidales bacterium]